MPYDPYFNSMVPSGMTAYELVRRHPELFRFSSIGGVIPTDGVTYTNMGDYPGFQGWFNAPGAQNLNHNVNFTMPGQNLPAVIPAATSGGSIPNADKVIDAETVGSGTGKAGLKGLFSGLRGKFGPGKSLLSGTFDLSALKGLGRDIRATKLWEGGPKLGTVGALGMGAYQGINAVKGLTENAQADTDYNSLIKDIKASAYANPMASQYLDSAQNKLLRQARTGSLDTSNWGGAAAGAAQGIPKALLAALIGGVSGGGLGAALGGLGSLTNSAIQGYGDRTREQTDKLSGLYSALQNAETSYRDEANSRIRNRHFNRMY